ncbi:MAG: hypothetical protein HGB29_08235 [Chlorobiaceae bacterium]|jgi:hypothetical protein|nr:hypothetical protein [Chlorobiaceae bacterium]NTW74837.1 hypothetical protein [Chlorobiaceae bacterium]
MKVESRKRQSILEGKIKPGFCEGCGCVTDQTFVGEWKPSDKPKEDDLLLGSHEKRSKDKKGAAAGQDKSASENQYWIRCSACNQVHLLKEWQIQIDRDLSPEELSQEDCQLYTPHGIYAQGDAVYHEALGEVGVVREKQATGSGAHVIIVEFCKSGRKQLLENVQLKQLKQGKQKSSESLSDIIKLKLRR